MDILTLILAMKLGGGISGANCADRADLAALLVKHKLWSAYLDDGEVIMADENDTVLTDENYAALIGG